MVVQFNKNSALKKQMKYLNLTIDPLYFLIQRNNVCTSAHI